MKLKKWKAIGLTAFLTLALAACNTNEEAEKETAASKSETTEQAKHKEEVHTEENEQAHKEEHGEVSVGARYIVSSETAVHVLNEKFEEVQKFDIGSGAFTVADAGRYVFVRDAANKDSYTLLDSGLYVEDHGDHLHPYEEAPILAKSEIAANKPTHMISHAGRTAIFNDGSGKVDVYENAQLSTDELKQSFVYEGAAHHGAAVPLSTGELAVTYVANEGDALPTGVKIVDTAGNETARVTDHCEGLHGTAYTGEGATEKLAFGCIGKVVVYDVATKKATDVPLPDVGARVGTVKIGEASNYFVTNYSVEGQEQNKIGVVNAETAEFRLVELPAAYKSALLAAPNNQAYVLAADGNVYHINLDTAKIETTIAALNPFNLDEEAPALFMANSKVYVMMPSFQKIYAVHGNHVHEEAKLDFVPTAITAVEIAK